MAAVAVDSTEWVSCSSALLVSITFSVGVRVIVGVSVSERLGVVVTTEVKKSKLAPKVAFTLRHRRVVPDVGLGSLATYHCYSSEKAFAFKLRHVSSLPSTNK